MSDDALPPSDMSFQGMTEDEVDRVIEESRALFGAGEHRPGRPDRALWGTRLGLALLERGQRKIAPRLAGQFKLLFERVLTRQAAAGTSGDSPLRAQLTNNSADSASPHPALNDADEAVAVLRAAIDLSAGGDAHNVRTSAGLATALMLRYLVRIPDGDVGDAREAVRRVRVIVDEHGDTFADTLPGLPIGLRRLLITNLMQVVWASAPFGSLAAGGLLPATPDGRGLLSTEDDIQLLERLLDGEIDSSPEPDPQLLLFGALLTYMLGPERRPDYQRYLARLAALPPSPITAMASFLQLGEKIAPRDVSPEELRDMHGSLKDLAARFGRLSGLDGLEKLVNFTQPDAMWQFVMNGMVKQLPSAGLDDPRVSEGSEGTDAGPGAGMLAGLTEDFGPEAFQRLAELAGLGGMGGLGGIGGMAGLGGGGDLRSAARGSEVRGGLGTAPGTGESVGAVPDPAVAADRAPRPDPFPELDLQAAVLVSDASPYPFTAPFGQVLEAVDHALAYGSNDGATAATLSAIRAMALHRRWLRERDGRDLAGAVALVREAVQAVAADDALNDASAALSVRLRQFLADLLSDRFALLGDRADLETARRAYVDLLRLVSAVTNAAPEHGHELVAASGLPSLLHDQCIVSGLPLLAELLEAGHRLSASAANQDSAADRSAEPGAVARTSRSAGTLRGELLAAFSEAESRYLAASESALAESEAAAQLISLFDAARRALPDYHPRSAAVRVERARLAAARAAAEGDSDVFCAEVHAVLDAASACAPDNPYRSALLVRAGAATASFVRAVMHGQLDSGLSAQAAGFLDRCIEDLEDAFANPSNGIHGTRARCSYGLGRLLHVRYLHRSYRSDLDRAVEVLTRARDSLESPPGDALAALLAQALADAYRAYGPADQASRRRAREAAKSALGVRAQMVLLQAGTRLALDAARLAEHDTVRLARWCLADHAWAAAVEALELGRGLVLHAATVAADVPVLLRTAGHQELAGEWERAVNSDTATAGAAHTSPTTVPDSLRRRVLEVLRGRAAEARLVSAPSAADTAAALRRVGADMLVHLVPGDESMSGYALLITEAGEVTGLELRGLGWESLEAVQDYAAALRDYQDHVGQPSPSPGDPGSGRDEPVAVSAVWEQALEKVCDWAGRAVMQPLLERALIHTAGRQPRLVLAPAGPLGLVPWHAARLAAPDPAGRSSATRGPAKVGARACQHAVISFCATARQLIEASARPQLSPGDSRTVIIADPESSPAMQQEARVVRSEFYSRCTVIGGFAWVPDLHGPWTGPAPLPAGADELLAHMPGRGPASPALLVATCHAASADRPELSRLQLSSNTGVTVEQVLAGALYRETGEPGGLTVLADCSSDLALDRHDEALTLATAFLAAGSCTVVGARWPVGDDSRSTVMMYMFHHFLSGRTCPADQAAAGSPVDALTAAQRWMLDPDRCLPEPLRAHLSIRDRSEDRFDELRIWAVFTHHGR